MSRVARGDFDRANPDFIFPDYATIGTDLKTDVVNRSNVLSSKRSTWESSNRPHS